MTAQEAIDLLDTLDGMIEDNHNSDYDSAFKMAIKALEKQIPKKVIFEYDGDSLLCPNCGLDLMGSITEPDHDPYYCFECGQALLWEK